MKHRYCKDKSGKRIGCFVATLHPADGSLVAGWSKLHKLDYNKKFDRDKCLMIARGRAIKMSKTIIPHKLIKPFINFILDMSMEFNQSVVHPTFDGSSTFEKIKIKWGEDIKRWQEKVVSKDLEKSAINNGQIISPASLETK